MHITGERGGTPVKVGVAVTDILTGHYAHSGVLAALIKRGRTGKGSRVECSLFESQIASLANIGANYLIAGQEATRWGTSHPSIVPYQVFPTKDSYIMLSAGNDGQFGILCGPDVFNRPEWLADDRFSKNAQRVANRDLMIELITKVLSEHTTEEWVERLTGKGLPFAPINNIAQTFAHPQAKARNVVEEVEHPRAGKIKLAAAAVTYDGEKPKVSYQSADRPLTFRSTVLLHTSESTLKRFSPSLATRPLRSSHSARTRLCRHYVQTIACSGFMAAVRELMSRTTGH